MHPEPASPARALAPARGARGIDLLRQAPATPILLAGIAVLVWLATQDGGYDVRAWAAGGVVLWVLLVLGAAVLPGTWRAVPRTTLLAGGLLTAYCAWSYASVAWAADPGAAWQGANRTVVFLAAFGLMAAWRQRPATAGLLLGLWTTAVTVLALVITVRLLTTDDLRTLLPAARLLDPTGYPNATAALFTMACFTAIVCATGRGVSWWLRGAAGGAAVVLAEVALLAVSRGSLLATATCLVLFLVVFPGRVRHLALLLPVAAAIGLVAPRVLELTDVLSGTEPAPGLDEARAAMTATLLAAGAVAVLLGALGAVAARRPVPADLARRAHRGGAVLAAVGVLAALGAGVAVVGDPVTRLDDAWDSFKGGYGQTDGRTRLVSGLGSNRYDFYRVSVASFRDHPVAGAGVDNFYATYLREGRSDETPRYPHSLPLRTLAETGVVGALLLFGAMGAALVGALRACLARSADARTRVVATGAVLAFAYWFVHGSADWFFEYGGLGAAAFALLGLACALDPARPEPALEDRATRRRGRLVAVGLLAALPALALATQWIADRDTRRAAATFATDPAGAYDQLDRARTLDPFSGRPDSLAGSIAVRLGDLPRALGRFERVLDRSPDDQYAQLQIGAIQSALGRRDAARGALERAVALAPRDALAREALKVVRRGGTIDTVALSARILSPTQDRG